MHLLFHIRTPRSSGSLPTSLAAISQSSLLCPPILPKTLTGQGPWTPSWGSSLSPLMISSTNNRLSAEDIQFLLLAYNSHLISKLVFSMAYLIYPLGCRVDILNLTHPKLNSDFLLLNESLPHVHWWKLNPFCSQQTYSSFFHITYQMHQGKHWVYL